MRAMRVLAIAAVLSGCDAATSPERAKTAVPTVLVSGIAPTRGTLPQTVTAYGSVAPVPTGMRTFSEAQPGQITRLLVVPGAAVRRGQPLATFATAPASRSLYRQAIDALTAARKQRASTAQLLAQQLATRDQFVQAEKAESDAQIALAALQADGAGKAEQTLTAPYDGVVTSVTVAQGDRTVAGAPILTVAKASGIVVTAGIDPAERGRVAVGQAAALTRLSGGPPLNGRVLRVGNALNGRTRLIDVDVAFPSGILLPGEGMQVAITTAQVAGWVVPHRAVVTAGGPPRVFQIGGGRARAVPVTIVLASDAGDVVSGPLDPRRRLIVDGAYQVRDGDAVRWQR